VAALRGKTVSEVLGIDRRPEGENGAAHVNGTQHPATETAPG
jgi:hypothetical protein